jgi:SAM-dependent methyltransferase
MSDYTDETYGEHLAGVYDAWFPDCDPDATAFLAEIAQGGKALELGIGTGRMALPLAARNVEVHGIDASTSMVSRLHEKPGGGKINVTMGDFSKVTVEGKFALVYVVFNTFFVLQSQEAQVSCFRNVAAHLTEAGCFVIEAFVPDVTRFTRGQSNLATKVTTDRVELDMSEHQPATQRVISQKVVLRDGSIRLYPVQIRYAWPAEMDLMAQLAGLRLRDRWSGWRREPFTSESQKHISVYDRFVKS